MIWLAPGIDWPRNSAQASARHDGGLGRVHVEVTRARVPNVPREDILEQLVETTDVRVVDIPRAAPRLEQEERSRR